MTDGPGPWGPPPEDEGRDRPPSSPYGSPPPAPSGPDPYGAPPQGGDYPVAPGYQAPPAGYYPPPPTAQLPPGTELASWGSRAGAIIIDSLILFALIIPAAIIGAIAIAATTEEGSDEPGGLGMAVLIILLIAFGLVWLYNQTWMQGQKGATWGKQVMGIRLVRESDLQPIGGGLGIARYFIRWILGQVTCGLYSLLTYLWPLWDEKNQSLDDKILKTLVVRPPK